MVYFIDSMCGAFVSKLFCCSGNLQMPEAWNLRKKKHISVHKITEMFQGELHVLAQTVDIFTLILAWNFLPASK